MKKNLLITFIFSLIFQLSTYAQFNTVWNASFAHTLTPAFSNEGRKVVADANGNTFVLADATSDIDPSGTQTSNTYYYAVLLKYDATGALVNSANILVNNHTVSGFSSKSAFGLAIDPTGNIYVGYNFYDIISGFDVRVAKYDNSLTMQAFYKFNPLSSDYGISMVIDASGTAYVLAKSVSGTGTVYHILKSDAVIIALTAIFSFDSDIDVLTALVLDNNQNVYTTGYRLVSGYKNFLTASVSSTGTLRWKSIYNGGSVVRDDFGTNLIMGTDNYLYVIGSSDRGGTSGSNYDAAVIKHYPPNGKKVWQNYYHYNNLDNGLFINNWDANYMCIGYSSTSAVLFSRISTTFGTVNGRLIYQPKPDIAHNLVSSTTLTDVKVSSNFRVYLTGTISATDTLGQAFNAAYLTKFSFITGSRSGFRVLEESHNDGEFSVSYASIGMALNYSNNNVLWLRDKYIDNATHNKEIVDITSLDATSSFRAENNTGSLDEISGIEVFPNPASGITNLFSQDLIVKAEIFNTAGQLIHSKEGNESNTLQLDLTGLENGMYVIRIETVNNGTSYHKFIKN